MTELESAQQAKKALFNIDLAFKKILDTSIIDVKEYYEIKVFINSIISKHTTLTDKQRKEIEEEGWRFAGNHAVQIGCYPFYHAVLYKPYSKYESINGYGHTEAEAKKDAYIQWKEAKK